LYVVMHVSYVIYVATWHYASRGECEMILDATELTADRNHFAFPLHLYT